MYTDSPFQPLVNHWLKKIDLAWKHKKLVFQDDADEAARFYNGPYDFMYDNAYRSTSKGFNYVADGDSPSPSFRMTVNKVAELVQIYGPVLYHKNPNRQVQPREFPDIASKLMAVAQGMGVSPDPNMQMQAMQMQMQLAMSQQQLQSQQAQDAARSELMQSYLNYTPAALDLKTESRWAIEEALIKGMGVLWTELYTPPGSNFTMAGSFFDTVDNLVIDPDPETLRNAKWVARRYIKPCWELEQEYGLEPDSIKGNVASFESGAHMASDPSGLARKREGKTNDLVVYWRIYSKMGFGTYLAGVPADMRGTLEMFGPYCHLVVCESCPYFLNLPPNITDAMPPEQVGQYVQWPTPFWADDGWPFTPITFHSVPREIWPMSHVKPAMGELKFLNWAYSFLAGKIRTACRDFLTIMKGAGEEIKKSLLRGTDYELIEIERAHGTISEIVQFLQHPPFHGDIWTVIQAVEANFEKRTGLTELAYGQSPFQMRSASEAQVKSDSMKVRPDDMANRVEDAMAEVSKKEGLAARWHLQPQDIVPVLGQDAANWWAQLIQQSDPAATIHQLEYRVEAGSVRKPNRERDAKNMQDALQTLLPTLWAYAQATGQTGPFDALVSQWAKTIDLDPKQFLLPVPPPPVPPPGGPPAGASGSQEKSPPKQPPSPQEQATGQMQPM